MSPQITERSSRCPFPFRPRRDGHCCAARLCVCARFLARTRPVVVVCVLMCKKEHFLTNAHENALRMAHSARLGARPQRSPLTLTARDTSCAISSLVRSRHSSHFRSFARGSYVRECTTTAEKERKSAYRLSANMLGDDRCELFTFRAPYSFLFGLTACASAEYVCPLICILLLLPFKAQRPARAVTNGAGDTLRA